MGSFVFSTKSSDERTFLRISRRNNGNLVCVESPSKYYYGILGKGINDGFDPLRQLNGPEGRIGVCP
ncbi:MAG: hypothetical protein AAB425_12500 [Bdellovibrionota bacterium]